MNVSQTPAPIASQSATLAGVETDGFAAAVGERGTLPGDSAGEPLVGLPWAALRRLYTVAAVLAVASLTPYLHDSLEDYRYWDRLDASPLLRAATFTPPPKEGAVGTGQTPPSAADNDRELDGSDLDELAGLGPVDPAEAVTAVVSTLPAALVVSPKDITGQRVLLEHPERLSRFWHALADLAGNKRPRVRIAHYGDSHLANDGQSHILRQLLQRRFGDGGHGFALVAPRTQWYSHRGVERKSSEGWKILNFLAGNAQDGAYGYAGFAAEGGPGQWFSLASTAKHPGSQFTLFFRSIGAATVQRSVDGKSEPPLVVRQEDRDRDFADTLNVPDGVHTVRWRVGAGRVRWFGGAVERDKGIVYDSLGEVGTRGTRWSQVNPESFKQISALRPADLFILDYGGNERVDRPSEDSYIAKLTGVVQMFRAAQPSADCVLFGPPDHGHKKAGKVISDPVIVKLVGWQRKVADATGCAFFDQRQFMGGDGSMGTWVSKGLGWGDYAHFTPQGERVMAQGIYRALLAGGHAVWKDLAAPPAPQPVVVPVKKPAKPKPKPVVKAKPAAKLLAKPAAKAKPGAKPVAKPVVKPKPGAKPVAKPPLKPAVKPKPTVTK